MCRGVKPNQRTQTAAVDIANVLQVQNHLFVLTKGALYEFAYRAGFLAKNDPAIAVHYENVFHNPAGQSQLHRKAPITLGANNKPLSAALQLGKAAAQAIFHCFRQAKRSDGIIVFSHELSGPRA
jgi:hypothetical protein